MQYHSINKKKKKHGKLYVFLLCLIVIWIILLKNMFWDVSLDKMIVVKSWDTFGKFVQELPKMKQFGLKFRVKNDKSILDISEIEEWTYVFSWEYSQKDYLKVIAEWPKTMYKKYTVLEWRSVYDIDDDLTKKWIISQWEYIDFVTNSTYISRYKNRYEFLSKAWDIVSLEWFLYPDTYNIDVQWNFVDQLVYLQLDNFNNRVWQTYSSKVSSFSKLKWYDIIILASIIEKEEKNDSNKPTVAWIFLNRLDLKMLLWADITLCYGLKKPYSECTTNVIVKNLEDTSNVYNTRANAWIPPQPISNPAVTTISAVLNYNKTDYLYYLHDNSWVIHYGKTLSEHNSNKQKYLK